MNNDLFLKKLRETETGKEYLQLIEEAKRKNRDLVCEKGFEKHHIQPKGLGGSLQDLNNLVKLTVFEHCKAHALLALTFNEKAPALKALSALSMRQFDQLSSEERAILESRYSWQVLLEQALKTGLSEESRKRAGKAGSKTRKGYRVVHKGNHETRIPPGKLDSYLEQGYTLGAKAKSEEVLASIREKRKGISSWNKGKPWPVEIKAKMSLRKIGNKNRKGTQTSSEARKRFSEAAKKRWEDPEYRKKCTEGRKGKDVGKLTGKVSIHKGSLEMKIFPEQLENYLRQGWIKGGKIRKKYEKHSK